MLSQLRVDKNPQKGFGMAEVFIPAIGLWKGDPRVLSGWGRQAVCMEMCRRRIDPDMGETMHEEDLVLAYARGGVVWHHTEDGKIQLAGPGLLA